MCAVRGRVASATWGGSGGVLIVWCYGKGGIGWEVVGCPDISKVGNGGYVFYNSRDMCIYLCCSLS